MKEELRSRRSVEGGRLSQRPALGIARDTRGPRYSTLTHNSVTISSRVPGPTFHTLNTTSKNNSLYSHLYTFAPHSPNELTNPMTIKSLHSAEKPTGNIAPSCGDTPGAALQDTRRLAPDANCPRCDAVEGTAEHVLLHCPALQIHRDSHHIHSLEHLWERPEEAIDFLRDASII